MFFPSADAPTPLYYSQKLLKFLLEAIKKDLIKAIKADLIKAIKENKGKVVCKEDFLKNKALIEKLVKDLNIVVKGLQGSYSKLGKRVVNRYGNELEEAEQAFVAEIEEIFMRVIEAQLIRTMELEEAQKKAHLPPDKFKDMEKSAEQYFDRMIDEAIVSAMTKIKDNKKFAANLKIGGINEDIQGAVIYRNEGRSFIKLEYEAPRFNETFYDQHKTQAVVIQTMPNDLVGGIDPQETIQVKGQITNPKAEAERNVLQQTRLRGPKVPGIGDKFKINRTVIGHGNDDSRTKKRGGRT